MVQNSGVFPSSDFSIPDTSLSLCYSNTSAVYAENANVIEQKGV